MARRPETHKRTLKSPLTAEVMGALIQRPRCGSSKWPMGLRTTGAIWASCCPWGRGARLLSCRDASRRRTGSRLWCRHTPVSGPLATLREVLRDAPEGVDTVLGARGRLRTRSPRRQAMQKALASFRAHRPRMRSGVLRAQNLPIGSGVVRPRVKRW